MPDPVDRLRAVGESVRGLSGLGLEPVLVGGMALVVLGSRRVTRDVVALNLGMTFGFKALLLVGAVSHLIAWAAIPGPVKRSILPLRRYGKYWTPGRSWASPRSP